VIARNSPAGCARDHCVVMNTRRLPKDPLEETMQNPDLQPLRAVPTPNSELPDSPRSRVLPWLVCLTLFVVGVIAIRLV
jgi:hypothetical protein